jgi:hypothetical protein
MQLLKNVFLVSLQASFISAGVIPRDINGMRLKGVVGTQLKPEYLDNLVKRADFTLPFDPLRMAGAPRIRLPGYGGESSNTAQANAGNPAFQPAANDANHDPTQALPSTPSPTASEIAYDKAQHRGDKKDIKKEVKARQKALPKNTSYRKSRDAKKQNKKNLKTEVTSYRQGTGPRPTWLRASPEPMVQPEAAVSYDPNARPYDAYTDYNANYNPQK